MALKLLEIIDPKKVREAAPHCEMLFTEIIKSIG